jgi:uncharacterized protein
MSLEDKINADYIQAMKDRDSVRSTAVNFLRAKIKDVKVEKRVEKVADEDIIAVIKKQVKQRMDSISQFNNGGRADLAAKEEAEMALLKAYLPAEMSTEALTAIVDEVIKSTGASSIKDMGKVMKEVQAKVAGKADNQAVSALVKSRLS